MPLKNLNQYQGNVDRVNRRQVSAGGVQFGSLPTENADIGIAGLTTIDVTNLTFVALANVGAVTVVNITGGSDGRMVRFLGDGQTTFADNTVIHTSTGANKLLAVDLIYTFTFYQNEWYENA